MKVYAIPLRNRFRGITVREGVLLPGPAGWGEFCPFADYSDAESVPWLQAALEASETGWPAPVRDRVEVNTTVPVVSPEKAYDLVRASGCRTAKVKVADPRSSLADDCERVAAVRDALGPSGAVRIDANMAWDVDTAVRAITTSTRRRAAWSTRNSRARRSRTWRRSAAGCRSASQPTSRSAGRRTR